MYSLIQEAKSYLMPLYHFVTIDQTCCVYVAAFDMHIELKCSHRLAFASVFTIVELVIAPNCAVRKAFHCIDESRPGADFKYRHQEEQLQ